MSRPSNKTLVGRPDNRDLAMQRAFYGAWGDAAVLGLALQSESMNQPGWKPLRAAVLHAQADLGPRVWMTAGELVRWRIEQQALDKVRKRPRGSADRATGLNAAKVRNIVAGLPVRKVTALACAHYALDLPLPPADLLAWYASRFALAQPVYQWLEMGAETFGQQVRGFKIHHGARIEAPASEAFLRALAWLDRMGPICPYGERAPITAFPPGG